MFDFLVLLRCILSYTINWRLMEDSIKFWILERASFFKKEEGKMMSSLLVKGGGKLKDIWPDALLKVFYRHKVNWILIEGIIKPIIKNKD